MFVDRMPLVTNLFQHFFIWAAYPLMSLNQASYSHLGCHQLTADFVARKASLESVAGFVLPGALGVNT